VKKKKRGRPAKLVTEKGERKLFAWVEFVARHRCCSIREACRVIVEDPILLYLDPVNGDRFTGSIDNHGWMRGEWVDDKKRPASASNFSTAAELRKTYYRLRKKYKAVLRRAA
jgi:hypothetical protein